MKKSFLFFFALVLFFFNTNAQKGYEAQFSQPTNSEYQISFSITDWDIQNVQYDGVNFKQIVFSSSALTQEKGWAELPFVTASVQLPAQKNVDLSITYTEFTDYPLDFPLVPSRGTISRSQDPSTIPYEIDPASIVDRFYPNELAVAEDPFIIRDVRGTTVIAYPFQWNAVTQTLRVYTKMIVTLTENNQPATNPLLKENPNPVREVRGMYKSIFINYQEARIPLVMAEYGDILVITTGRDEDAIQPYIDWKKEKGYNVEKEVVATGASATVVKSLITTKYNDNPNLMYVLLVGGWNDIKSDMMNSVMQLGSGPTDPMLGDVAGTVSDYRPDISIGRISAENSAQVTVQVNKAIQYERNPNMDAGWYESFIGIGSNQGGTAYQGDDMEIDYVHVQRIYTERLQEPTFTYNTHYQNYGASPPASTLATHINTGATTIAYCGHGDWNMFITTGFNNNNVNQLTNGTKLPFIVSVACLNGAFHNHNGSCFAETWLKKENGGAVVTWMSTINQPWNEPMRGQDYFYDILIGGFDYNQYPGQNGINTDEQRTHWGSIAVNAVNLMLSEVPGTGDKETVRTWTTFGDPNLQLRTKLPAVIVSSNDIITPALNYETTITTEGVPVEGALVCLSQDDVYVKGFTDELGNISIEHPFLFGEVRLVVTAFNTTTIYETMEVMGEIGELYPPLNLTYKVENANHVLLKWDEPQGSSMPVKGYNVYRNDELITFEPVRDEVTFTDIAPKNGEYTYTVTALYNNSGSLESEPSEPKTVTITGMCVAIERVIVQDNDESSILVSWEKPEYEGIDLAGYNVYRDNEKLNGELIPATELSYLDENLEFGTQYCYQVEVVYNDCEETLITDENCQTLSIHDISGANNFVIYPNPANNVLYVTMGHDKGINPLVIEIYDIYGRKQKAESRKQNEFTIDISDLPTGLYFVKIYTETNDFAVKRLVIMK